MEITPQIFAERLLAQNHILILTHRRPDGDTVGCAAALCLALRRAGKTAYALENPDITSVYADYLAPFLAPADFAPRCVVAVDMASRSMFPENAAKYLGTVDLTVDHHPSQEFYARETCLDASAAACGEIVYEVCRAIAPLDGEIARTLYLAVATDTGCFVYSNVTARTHAVAAALLAQPFDAAAVNKRHFRTKTQTRLRLEAALIDGMELHDGGRIAVLQLPLSLMARLHATEADADDIASLANLLEGVDCGVILRQLAEGKWKISLRTGSRINASRACALLGGGGHAAAAGCTVEGTAEQAKAAVLAAVAEVAHG
ncbi:MAG: bifunctional oligoribonuclease/PAP phosphatase NrnA [Oscillospiraceae bacterium]